MLNFFIKVASPISKHLTAHIVMPILVGDLVRHVKYRVEMWIDAHTCTRVMDWNDLDQRVDIFLSLL